MRRSPSQRSLWLLCALLLAGLLVGLLLPFDDLLPALQDWLAEGGILALVVFLLLFTLWALLLPPMPLQIIAGYLYGLVGGGLLIYAGSTLAMILAWFAARSWLRRPVQGLIARRPLLRAIDQAFDEAGWRTVLLLRLANIMPSNIVNLVCGCSGQSLWTILWASWLGKFPGVAMSVLIGLAGRQILDHDPADERHWTWISIAIGIVASIALGTVLTRRTRRLLAAELADDSAVVDS